MPKHSPTRVEHARRSLTAPPVDPADTLPRIARVVNWIILRDSRPRIESPAGEVIAFPVSRQQVAGA